MNITSPKEHQSASHRRPWEVACLNLKSDTHDEVVTIKEVIDILELPQRDIHKFTVMRIAKILQKLGCTKKRSSIPRNGIAGRYYIYTKER